MKPVPSITAIILAAGASRRLGRPKQLELINGVPLIRHAINMVSSLLPVAVVVGDHRDAVIEAAGNSCTIIDSPNWSEGMAAPLRAGIRWASERNVEAVLILLVDQYRLTASDIAALISAYQSAALPMAASTYLGDQNEPVIGVPAIFHRSVFSELLTLVGDQGARKLLRSDPQRVATIALENAAFDLDAQ